MDILSHFDEVGFFELTMIAPECRDDAIGQLAKLECEGVVRESTCVDWTLKKYWWEDEYGSMRQTRAWMLTELGKIYIDTL